ncbi:J domain-containing protein [Streptomyces sp. ISL-96]|uniref:J domain-containing protein n=1 Tax=Streptomyces sp. ISL-96 TaxID=2819191 RepID=UPI001BE9EA3B|nr:J domain-containing protein [Streptomyces sp. ISL-96]MBT2489669.1 J domain-containing protein [Streptomyces sp. ISL-96]
MAVRGQRNPYAVLGVEPTASAVQITSAFRKLVRTLHPDSQPEQPSARRQERLDEVVAAYATLRDPRRRAEYDAKRTRAVAARRAREPRAARVGVRPANGYAVVSLGVRLRPPVPSAPLRAGPVRIEPFLGR